VRWIQLENSAQAWRIELDRPMHISVSRYSDEQLADVTHNVELVPEDCLYVHIDAAHRGLGTASCGPDTLEQYRVPTGLHEWTWRVKRLR
jgi:beta-galactosidase